MRKITSESPILDNEELTTELIELSCDSLDSLTQTFEMISKLCESLRLELLHESFSDIPEEEIN